MKRLEANNASSGSTDRKMSSIIFDKLYFVEVPVGLVSSEKNNEDVGKQKISSNNNGAGRGGAVIAWPCIVFTDFEDMSEKLKKMKKLDRQLRLTISMAVLQRMLTNKKKKGQEDHDNRESKRCFIAYLLGDEQFTRHNSKRLFYPKSEDQLLPFLESVIEANTSGNDPLRAALKEAYTMIAMVDEAGASRESSDPSRQGAVIESAEHHGGVNVKNISSAATKKLGRSNTQPHHRGIRNNNKATSESQQKVVAAPFEKTGCTSTGKQGHAGNNIKAFNESKGAGATKKPGKNEVDRSSLQQEISEASSESQKVVAIPAADAPPGIQVETKINRPSVQRSSKASRTSQKVNATAATPLEKPTLRNTSSFPSAESNRSRRSYVDEVCEVVPSHTKRRRHDHVALFEASKVVDLSSNISDPTEAAGGAAAAGEDPTTTTLATNAGMATATVMATGTAAKVAVRAQLDKPNTHANSKSHPDFTNMADSQTIDPDMTNMADSQTTEYTTVSTATTMPSLTASTTISTSQQQLLSGKELGLNTSPTCHSQENRGNHQHPASPGCTVSAFGDAFVGSTSEERPSASTVGTTASPIETTATTASDDCIAFENSIGATVVSSDSDSKVVEPSGGPPKKISEETTANKVTADTNRFPRAITRSTAKGKRSCPVATTSTSHEKRHKHDNMLADMVAEQNATDSQKKESTSDFADDSLVANRLTFLPTPTIDNYRKSEGKSSLSDDDNMAIDDDRSIHYVSEETSPPRPLSPPPQRLYSIDVGMHHVDKLRECLRAVSSSELHVDGPTFKAGGSTPFSKNMECIYQFLLSVVADNDDKTRNVGPCRALYVCGGPGTGKTSGVEYCCRKALAASYLSSNSSASGGNSRLKVCHINASHLKSSKQQDIWSDLVQKMGRSLGMQSVKNTKSIFTHLRQQKPKRAVLVIVVDEIDSLLQSSGQSLATGEQAVQTLLTYSSDPSVPLVMIGISNDVGSWKFTRLRSLGQFEDITFETYNLEELVTILEARVSPDVMSPAALRYIAQSVVARCGDARKALAMTARVLRHTLENRKEPLSTITNNVDNNNNSQSRPISIKEVKQATANDTDCLFKRIDGLAVMGKVIICIIATLTKVSGGGSHSFTMIELREYVVDCLRSTGRESEILPADDFKMLLETLGDMDLIQLDGDDSNDDNHDDRNRTKITTVTNNQLIRLRKPVEEVQQYVDDELMKHSFYRRLQVEASTLRVELAM